MSSLEGRQELDFNIINQVNTFIVDDFEYSTIVGSVHE